MRIAGAALLLVVASIVGCDRSTPLQPGEAPPGTALRPSASASGKPEIDPTYANGTTVYMIGPHMVAGAAQTQPNLYARAEELYLVVYPQHNLPAPGDGPITLPSGYEPQCNPCFHPGLPAPFVYHDHVVTGAPGMGNHGTAGVYLAPWKIILLMYDSAYAASPTFKPVTSEAELDAAETAGNVFTPINKGAENPYEIDTGNLLICPMVSSHA